MCPTCTAITYTWDKVTNAEGYFIELSKNSNFSDTQSSGQLGSDRSDFTFDNLSNDTTYYARVTLAGISNFPQYNYASAVKTKCGATTETTATATPTPTPTKTTTPTKTPVKTKSPSPTPTPKTTVTPRPTAAASVVVQNIGSKVGGNLGTTTNPSLVPTTTDSEQPMSFIQWLIAQISKLFGGQQ